MSKPGLEASLRGLIGSELGDALVGRVIVIAETFVGDDRNLQIYATSDVATWEALGMLRAATIRADRMQSAQGFTQE